ncbi:MAG: hypothetical protein ROW52_08760, partial [Anaerolineaceae bacterium]
EFVGLYAFVPFYNLSALDEKVSSIQVESDFTAWLGIMQRIKHMLKMDVDLADLEQNSRELTTLIDKKVSEVESNHPGLKLREYLKRLSDGFNEQPFNPLDEIWEDELQRLLRKMDSDEPADTH